MGRASVVVTLAIPPGICPKISLRKHLVVSNDDTIEARCQMVCRADGMPRPSCTSFTEKWGGLWSRSLDSHTKVGIYRP